MRKTNRQRRADAALGIALAGAVVAGLSLLGTPTTAFAVTASLPARDASFDQSIGYFIWPYQFGYQNVANVKSPGKLEAGEYNWVAPGFRDKDACLASLDAQIAQVKETGMRYVTVSYLISPLNAKPKADGTLGDPSIQGDCEPETDLNDAIINRILDAGLTPMVYFSQGNPDERVPENPVNAFTMEQIHATIEHAVSTFAGKGVIWESWNEPDSAGWKDWQSETGDAAWKALNQFIGDCVQRYDTGAEYVYGNWASPSWARFNNDTGVDAMASAGATAISGHNYGGGTPESAFGYGPSTYSDSYDYVDSEFGVPSSGKIRWAANNWGDWDPDGKVATEQSAETQAAWLGRQLLAKDIAGVSLATPYRLVGYDSFDINDNSDPANPGSIKTSLAYEHIKYLTQQLKGYTFDRMLPVDGHEYDGVNDGVETDFTSDNDLKQTDSYRTYAVVYKNAAGDEKLVYWHGGRTGVNADESPYVTPVDATKDVTVTFGGKDVKLTATSWARVYGTASSVAAPGTVVTSVGTAPSLPKSVEVTWADGIKTNETVAWDAVDASKYAQTGSFEVSGTAAGLPVTVTVNVKVAAKSYANKTIWKDVEGNDIQAHGGSVVRDDDGTFYWVGQGAPDNVPTGVEGEWANQWLFTTINMYRSKDLVDWERVNPVASIDDEDAALYASGNVDGLTQKVLSYTDASGNPTEGMEGLLAEHPQYASNAALGCKIERPHILKNDKTGKFVVWAHWEGTVGYTSSQLVCFESEGSDPTGPYHPVQLGTDGDGSPLYHMQPRVMIDGNLQSVPSRDLSVWQDPDTHEAYIISVFGSKGVRLYKLDDTFTQVEQDGSYAFMTNANVEAPSLFKENGTYYMFTSRQNYWDPTQTEYATTKDLDDPAGWSGLTEVQSRKDAQGSSYIGQPTYVLQYTDDRGEPAVLLMGDDWNPKKVPTANVDTTIANYVWNPVVRYKDGTLAVPFQQTVAPMDAGKSPVDAPPFTDVSTAAWYATPVTDAARLGYVKGFSGTTLFGPDQDITRADAVCVLFNMAGGDKIGDAGLSQDGGKTYDTGFVDADGSAYYAKALAWAHKNGVANGYNDGSGKFGPADQITREQFAALLSNYAKLKGTYVVPTTDLSAFKDANTVSDWAKTVVEWGVENKVLGNGGFLAGQSTITRAEVAAMAVNYQPEGVE